MSFNVSTTLIKSVSVITLTLQAQLVAYTIPNNYENYATQITDAVFNFTNSNCELLYVNSSSYFVINTLTQFYIHFSDDEMDRVLVDINQSDYFMFMTTFDQSTMTTKIMIQSNTSLPDLIIMPFSYTDIYHQDQQYWMSSSIPLYLFNSNPPVFDSEISLIHVNRWNSNSIELPSFSDPDSLDSK